MGGRGGGVAGGGVASIPAGSRKTLIIVLISCLNYANLNFVFIDVRLLFVATFALQWKEISAFGVTDGDFSHDSFVFKAYTSVVFGIEMWPAAEYGRTMYTIRQRVRPILMRTEKRYGDVVAVEIVVVVLVLLWRLCGGVDAAAVWLLLTVVGGDDGARPSPRLTPDAFEAQAEWWVSSRAFFEVHIREPPRIPSLVNQHSRDDVPEYIYRHMVEQDRLLKEAHAKDVMNRERRESRSSIFLQRPYMPLLATTIAPKKRANKSSNKKGNANVSAFDLGKAVVDDNAQDYEVMITGARATEDYVSFKNVDPNKVA
ncbi:hypothetical protein Tco_0300060 [Tanacetum coccineum]